MRRFKKKYEYNSSNFLSFLKSTCKSFSCPVFILQSNKLHLLQPPAINFLVGCPLHIPVRRRMVASCLSLFISFLLYLQLHVCFVAFLI